MFFLGYTFTVLLVFQFAVEAGVGESIVNEPLVLKTLIFQIPD
jgi:hypothetical protein